MDKMAARRRTGTWMTRRMTPEKEKVKLMPDSPAAARTCGLCYECDKITDRHA